MRTLLVLMAGCAALSAAESDPYLFLDDHWIAKRTGLVRSNLQPNKFPQPVLDSKTFGVTQPFVTVSRDPDSGMLGMWYCRTNELGFATSENGIQWSNPRVAYARKRAYGASVIDDKVRDPDPARRYKLADWESTRELDDTPRDDSGMYVTFSPDNLKWTRATNGPVLPSWPVGYNKYASNCVSDIIDAFFDPIHNRYAAAVKLMGGGPDDPWSKATRIGNSPFTRRIVGMTFSRDFVNWENPWRIIVPDEGDEGDTEFYGMGGVHARGSLLIGLVRVLRDDLPCDEGGPADGIGYTTLAWSRDGRNWTRDRKPFLDRNLKRETWDHAMAWGSSTVQIGDELYIYYGGYARGHKVAPTKERQIGLARMPLDRYVALWGNKTGGTLLTVPLDANGQSLLVNASVLRDMKVRVLQNGAPVTGFDWTNCPVIRGDSLAHRVRWDGGTRLPSGRVQLEFELKDAKLYAFQFTPEKEKTRAAVEYVVPVDWTKFRPYNEVKDRSKELTDCAVVFQNTIIHNLGWNSNAIAKLDGRMKFVGLEGLQGRLAHDFIRPICNVIFGFAVALKSGMYDEEKLGVSKKEVLSQMEQLVRGAAREHKLNAWERPWQSALWAAYLGQGAWMLWEELDPKTRAQVADIVEWEADRLTKHPVPYWNGRGGDTKAEENAWNTMVLSLAVGMMPKHPHARAWKEKCSELMISSFATENDQLSEVVVDGKPVRNWLQGFNANPDGSVVNHGFVHPDYTLCIHLNLRSFVIQPLAGQAVPEAADFNSSLVYRCLVTREWPSPPYAAPGGTIYRPGEAYLYYPEKADWGRVDCQTAYLVDSHVFALGLDKGLPHRAQDWMPVRAAKLLEMQKRHGDLRIWAAGENDAWPGREQSSSGRLGAAFLTLWLHAQDYPIRKGNWLAGE